MKRKVINWNEPDQTGRFEVFLECLHSVICHVQVDQFPEEVPDTVNCSECGEKDNKERINNRVKL